MRSIALTPIILAVLTLQTPAALAQSEDEKILEQPSQQANQTGGKSEGTSKADPVDDDEDELSTTYSSIGLERIRTKFDNVEDSINLNSTLVGFRIPTLQWFAIELNLGFTMIPGQITESTPGSAPTPTGCGPLGLDPCPGTGASTQASGDFGATTIGAFGVVRTPGKFFAMGKAGYRYLNTNLPELSEDRSGKAWGAGVGYRWNKKGSYAELGYTKYSDNISALGFSISYSYDRR